MIDSTASQTDDTPIATLFRHNLWSNLALLDACDTLDEAQLATTVEGTYGSIINTLRHIVRSEQSYIGRLTGIEPAHRVQYEDHHTVDQLRPYAREAGEALIAVAQASAAGDTLTLNWSEDGSVQITVPKAMIQAQSINHSTEHRTHVTTILTQLGIEPPRMDGWAYLEAYVESLPGE